jgi:hypothetical protein
MKFKLQMVIEDEQGQTQIEDVIQLEKNNDPGYCASLSLLESKQVLKDLQQMPWTLSGAHYLLQTRIATLNGELSDYFERWYPGLKINHVLIRN